MPKPPSPNLTRRGNSDPAPRHRPYLWHYYSSLVSGSLEDVETEGGMMERHVVSLEIAKQLKETGWNKKTKFWWVECYSATKRKRDWGVFDFYDEDDKVNPQISAPLTTEILEDLSAYIDPEIGKETNDILTITPCRIHRRKMGWRVRYGIQLPMFDMEKLADACALMWIHRNKKRMGV
jgi:hypothetical protein